MYFQATTLESDLEMIFPYIQQKVRLLPGEPQIKMVLQIMLFFSNHFNHSNQRNQRFRHLLITCEEARRKLRSKKANAVAVAANTSSQLLIKHITVTPQEKRDYLQL
jgi:hypothetical protein